MSLDRERQVKHWQRCHSMFLPSAYTGNESTRIMFALFSISALDLLSAPIPNRAAIRAWVLSLQHPDGGFSGSPTHVYAGQDAHKGCANLAATFFALVMLAAAAESDAEAKMAFVGVRRRKLLRWMRKLQREDGSFGQVLWDGKPVGGRDMRHSYLAAGIRWMLGIGDEDVDVQRMVAHIRATQTYDGGIAEASEHESHAGYAYCAIAALYMLERVEGGVQDREKLLRFLAQRQFSYVESDDEDEEGEENYMEAKLGDLNLNARVGFNGRWNKRADTCYTWWVVGTLGMLGNVDLVNAPPSRKFLLDVTQHRIGGFSKFAESPPDIYHSYLGLAALALMGEEGVKEFDVGLCCSKETVRKIALARGGPSEDAASFDDGFWECLS